MKETGHGAARGARCAAGRLQGKVSVGGLRQASASRWGVGGARVHLVGWVPQAGVGTVGK
jgi:hypothetical protein